MKAEGDTREILVGEAEHSQDDSPTPDLGPWGMEAVPLGKDERVQEPAESPRHAETKPHRWVALAAIACGIGLLAALGANAISGNPGPQIERPQTAQTNRQPPANELGTNGARAARQAEQRQQQARSKSRQRSIRSTRRAHPAPSSAHAPTSEPAPAPEPVMPSPASVPAPGPSPTTKPPPASGPAVAKEFGFER